MKNSLEPKLSTNKKPIIAIDIDDVIAANAPAFIKYSNQKFGTNLTVDDYQEHWGDLWKVEVEETEKRAIEYHESGVIATYDVISGALEVLKELKKRFRLVILTTRRSSIKKLTEDWIEKYYPNIFDGFVYSGFFDSVTKNRYNMTKAELAKNIKADYIIDDQLKHIEAAAELGIKGLLFGEYLWNKKDKLPSNVTRVKTWKEVSEYFKNK